MKKFKFKKVNNLPTTTFVQLGAFDYITNGGPMPAPLQGIITWLAWLPLRSFLQCMKKSCIDWHNARKFEKSSKIQSFIHLAITMMKLQKYHSHEFLKLS